MCYHVCASMRSRIRNLEFSKNILLVGMVAMFSFLSLTMLPQKAVAVPDKFGIEQLYPTADNGPVWFLNNQEPQDDDNFLMTSHEHIDLQEKDQKDPGAFELDAETGSERHGVRLHADS